VIRKVEAIIGTTGYRHQLDRARRFLDRVQNKPDWASWNEVEFQDMMWAFFQNCWHVKDWLKNDKAVSDAVSAAAIDLAHNQSPKLRLCQQLCNGMKHLGPRQSEASHHHIEASIASGWGVTNMDCIIDDGSGNLISGMELAQECIAEWERILQSQGLATARLS
jgi:hypothetical protein